MRTKNEETTPNTATQKIKPALYDEKTKEIKSIIKELNNSDFTKSKYKAEMQEQLAFINNELDKAKQDLKKAANIEEYEKADERIKRYSIQANYTKNELNKPDYLSPEDFEKYGQTITADYQELTEELKKKAVEKSKELFELVRLFNSLFLLSRGAILDLNRAAGMDIFDLNNKYPEPNDSYFYNVDAESKRLFECIIKSIRTEMYDSLRN